jgi:hypothetical protein
MTAKLNLRLCLLFKEMRPRRAVPVLAVLTTLCAVRPASADFLYDITFRLSVADIFSTSTHTQFIEPVILTSTTTVTEFLLNTATGPAVTSLVLAPDASGSCVTGDLIGPCLSLKFSDGSGAGIPFSSTFTSVGSYSQGFDTITISPLMAPVPEPFSVRLLATSIIMGASVFALKRRADTKRRGRW